MRQLFLGILLVGITYSPLALLAQGDVWLQPNRGQWNQHILYRVGLTKGNFFVEKNRFTFALNNHADVYEAAHHGSSVVSTMKFHTIRSEFVHSSWGGNAIESDSSSFYRNYFLGKDRTKWQSSVHSYKRIKLVDFYPGIHLIVQTTPSYIKYSFEVEPNVDPSIIQIVYKGMSELVLHKNELLIQTRFGPIVENGLNVFTKNKEGEKTKVACNFQLNSDTLGFEFPHGYDSSQTLIIDPNLVFSTFTGSTADNWGFTATPAIDGALIAGGIVFGVGYPITTGAYDNTYNNGVSGGTINNFKVDIGISKFSADGTQLLYSTLLGGTGNETPNSIIVDHLNNLYILGETSSTDFPTSSTAYQTTNHGGTLATVDDVNFNGTDIIVSKLNSTGTQLLASTYIGGSRNDGLNNGGLQFNYGDVFRGDIIIADNGDVLFTSSTQSSDFPIVNGVNSTLGGTQDAVVVKMTSDLSSVVWSTYFGGSDIDGGYSIAESSNHNIYITGGTKSSDLNFTSGHLTTFQGGFSDGFIAELNSATSSLINGTYLGTPNYDQSFFIDLDQSDKVYVFGQSNGNMPISANVYSNPNSGQFIQQYSSNLSTLNWSTVVGGGNNTIEISPTAFMVTDCNQIYYTGWGGVVNKQNSLASLSTTFGFPTTSDAYQSTTNGSNFYIGVLSDNAQSLVYGTFMGGTASSYNHVDGGTSRFGKDGSIYHAVCGGCGGNDNGFTTTPGAWSETNNSNNCNLAAWKFELMVVHSSASIPDPYICLPDSAFFSNNSVNGNIYEWNFGDGTTSSDYEPHHYYASPGTYHASLIVSNTDPCIIPDTAYMDVVITEFNGSVVQPPSSICPGASIQLQASGGSHYQWSPAAYLDDPTSATPTATLDSTTTFQVIVTDSCGIDTLTTTVVVEISHLQLTGNTTICKGDTVTITASGGTTYTWSGSNPATIIGATDQPGLKIAPKVDEEYYVSSVAPNGCPLTDSIFVTVIPHVPFPTIDDSIPLCKGTSKPLTVSSFPPTSQIVWSPAQAITPTTGHTVTVSTNTSRWYYIDLTNVCGTSKDSTFVDVITVHPHAGNDTIVCPGEIVNLWARGGVSYAWTPASTIYSPTSDSTLAAPKKTTTNYQVKVTDENGCYAFDSVLVKLFPEPYVIVQNPNFYGLLGDAVQLEAKGNGGNGTYTWTPPDYLSCVNCANPTATPPQPMLYTVSYEDLNGCVAKAAVRIHFDPLVYVPNTFTPDGQGKNNTFLPILGNILSYHLSIFNRWGELLFESYNPAIGWDGTYHNMVCPDGTYVWKIRYQDRQKINHDIVGHVNLIR